MSTATKVRASLVGLVRKGQSPSAYELIQFLEKDVGPEARWLVIETVNELADDSELTHSQRGYLRGLIATTDLAKALRGKNAPDRETISTIDLLLQQSRRYRNSDAFREMVQFMGQFKEYAPYNNMLVRLQNPSCGFYATATDWRNRFSRAPKEDSRPMLILAPMHPVLLVYDLDQTEGKTLPQELQTFSQFDGDWKVEWLSRLIENAVRHQIDIQFKTLSSTHGGYVSLAHGSGNWKMRVVIHDQLDDPSRFGVLCHELAHILLGHLGSDEDYWWPARTNLSHSTVEIEAEATAWIVTRHLGLQGSSANYVSRHLNDQFVPPGVSFDMIAKTAGKIERMAKVTMQQRKPGKRRKRK